MEEESKRGVELIKKRLLAKRNSLSVSFNDEQLSSNKTLSKDREDYIKKITDKALYVLH